MLTKNHNLIICLTVDWEGEHFKNIYDLQSLMQKYAGDVPVTHFICPAYFTSGLINSADKIKTVLKDDDEIALHLHPFKSLINYCRIPFRAEHNYHKTRISDLISHTPKPLRDFLERKFISGRGVPISVYTDNEIDRMIKKCLHLLQNELNIAKVYGFRAGGWLLRDSIFPLLDENGIYYDSSAVPPEILSKGYSKNQPGINLDDYGHDNGYFTKLITSLWGGNLQKKSFLRNRKIIEITNHQPVLKTTFPFNIGSIIEMPNNAGLSDFVSAQKTWIPLFHQSLEFSKETQKPFFFNFGCHQEGDASYKLTVAEFMEYVKPFMDQIQFMTVYQASQLAGKYL